jgi:hypothetical protein
VLELWHLIAIQLNVNAVICRGFSCRRLDETEEWLEVDFQISCLSDSYLAFVSLGMIGVFIYPLGIPTLSLLQLWRNAGDIKAGGPARERYEFLVGDYTPDYCECLVVMSMFSSDVLMSRVHPVDYWDCLEMLRKAFITGILMFFKKGTPTLTS